MSDEIREKKYKFESSIRLPNMQEILDAASDFTPPSEKKMEVAASETAATEKKSVMDLVHKPNLSPEQEELQKLGMEVANEEIRRAKEKERQRAEELRRLCREREELAQKKAEEEQKIANEEMKKAIQAAREKAQARKDAAAAAAEEAKKNEDATPEELSLDEQIDSIPASPDFKMPPVEKMPPVVPQQKEADSSDDTMVDISELAMNPFDDNAPKIRPVKEKEEFKETILEDDYKEKMDLREDSSESVEDDFLDF